MKEAGQFSEVLIREFSSVGTIDPAHIEALYAHYCLMVRWNRVLNLTTVIGLEESVVRHYCESLFLAGRLPRGSVTVLDVGSGPGFPGIPMAIVRPDCRFVLAESHQRKAVFLKEATRSMKNVEVASDRAEDVEGPGFEWVVSRAVRWESVAELACKSLALLLGQDDADVVLASPQFAWRPPESLPWGDRRVLVIGMRS